MAALRVQVFGSETKQGTSSGGKPYKFDVLQCVIHDGVKPLAGELMLPKDHPPVAAGFYSCVLGAAKDRDNRIIFRIEKLEAQQPVARVG